MKKAFALAAAAMLSVVSAHSAIVLQTQNYSNVGSTAALLTWNKFDLNLGTLTAITLEATGVLSGSYDVDNLDLEAPATLVLNSRGRIRLTFSGVGAPTGINGSLIDPLSTSPVSTSGQTIAPDTLQTFTLLSGAGVNESSFSSDQLANAAYYSAIGGGTFNSSLLRVVSLAVSGTAFNTDTAGVLAGGTINLTYEYTPAAVIPEPGTWAAAALLVGGAAFMRWRKRAKVS
ncbi:MAG: choice-of-anchor E domain-containing protein [Chthoniobacterales bacterium]|nr:choice-of-anchor E domain-containing protein [Chthoniobacterales bacterium]